MILVYIAGRYRGPTAWDVEQNIRRAEEMGLQVAALGAAPVIPHANNRYFHGTFTDEFWLAATLAMLDVCGAVMLVPGWEGSVGTGDEIDRAKVRGIPVFERIRDLAAWLKLHEELAETVAMGGG